MRKQLFFAIAISFGLSLKAEDLKILSLELDGSGITPQLYGYGISPDGRFVCGSILPYYSISNGVYVVDVDNNIFSYEYGEDYHSGCALLNVNDKGVAIGNVGDLPYPGCITYSWNGEKCDLNVTDSYDYVVGHDISNNGAVMVGSLFDKGSVPHGAYSLDCGVWTLLPIPPVDVPFWYERGSQAIGVSGDGKYIIGYAGVSNQIIMWSYKDDGFYEPDALFTRFCYSNDSGSEWREKPFQSLSPISISNNGKFILCQGEKVVFDDDDDCFLTSCFAVYNTETCSLNCYDIRDIQFDDNQFDIWASAISDDGTFVGNVAIGCEDYHIRPFIKKAGESQPQLLSDAFPKYADMFSLSDSWGYSQLTAADISADGNRILGYGYIDDTNHITYILQTNDEGFSVDYIDAPALTEQFYSVDGIRLSEMKKGVNIVRTADGSFSKVIRK